MILKLKKPLIGVDKLKKNTDLHGKSIALSESFRAIRSSLQYLYKNKTWMVLKH
jgi:hypothetical protein